MMAFDVQAMVTTFEQMAEAVEEVLDVPEVGSQFSALAPPDLVQMLAATSLIALNASRLAAQVSHALLVQSANALG
jgi:hypothetical protein